MKLSEILRKTEYRFGPIRVKTKDEIAKFNDELFKKGFRFNLDHDHKTNEGLFFFPDKKEHKAAEKLQQDMIATKGSFTGVDDKI